VDGLLLIDKPKDWTSFDVVAKVRGTIKREAGLKKPKVGHTGTLDPLATGLLVLCLGSYCKRASEFSKLDKTYEVTMKLGQTSATGDDEGEKTQVSDHSPAYEEVEDALKRFTGEISQVPPAYSAIKVDGQRAYKLARAGKEVKLEPRKVTIHSIENLEYAYPEIKFTVSVSSGTYIRTLVEDIGNFLGTGAYMNALRRTKVGDFSIQKAIQPEQSFEQFKESVQTLA
jgi:tRNA pseudouridine55 synthase